ncbi:MAG: hypothetical protein AAGI03_08285 [Pseudomonadota bacterium]
MTTLKSVFILMLFSVFLSGCATLNDHLTLTETERADLMAGYTATPDERRIDRNCITPDWPTVYGSTFTEDAFEARFSFVKRVGMNNGYLIEYNRSCRRLTRGGFAGAAVPVDCRGDIVRVRGLPCRVQSIYSAESEKDARRLALVIQEARRPSGLLATNGDAASPILP